MSHNAHGAQLALHVPSGLNTLPAACVATHRTFSATLTHDLIHHRSLHSLTSHSSLKVPHSLSSSEVVFVLIPNPKGKYCVFMGCCMVVLLISLFLLTVSFIVPFAFFICPIYFLFIQHLAHVFAYYTFMLCCAILYMTLDNHLQNKLMNRDKYTFYFTKSRKGVSQ